MVVRDGHAPVLGKIALALLRLLVASYFIAISLQLIPGVNAGLIFQTWFTEQDAHLVGNSMMVGCSVLIFLGLFLRTSCLYLALLVLCCTILENVVIGEIHAPDALWRDLVLVATLMLIYGSMSRQALGQIALVKNTQKVRKIRVRSAPVKPRRISPAQAVPEALARGAAMARAVNFPVMREQLEARLHDDVKNIFADIDFAEGKSAS